jgi:hypothetical protein
MTLVAIVLSLPWATAACSLVYPSASAVSTRTAVAAHTASTPIASPRAALMQLTGTKLKAALLPSSDFPSGFALAPDSAYNTGDLLTNGSPNYPVGTMSCDDLLNKIGDPGFEENALATNTMSNHASNGNFFQGICQFYDPYGASAFFSNVQAALGRCHSFTLTASGVSMTVTAKVTGAPDVHGHRAYVVSVGGTQQGTLLEDHSMLVLDDTDVCVAGRASIGGTLPTSPTLASIAATLIANIAPV